MKTPYTVSVPHIYRSIRTRQNIPPIFVTIAREPHNTESHMKTLSPQPSTLLNTHQGCNGALRGRLRHSFSFFYLSLLLALGIQDLVKRERLLLSARLKSMKGSRLSKHLKQKPHLKIKVFTSLLDMW